MSSPWPHADDDGSDDGAEDPLTAETLRLLLSRSNYPWQVWRGRHTRKWWAVPLWTTAPARVLDADHHQQLEVAMREVEQHHPR